MKLNVQGLGIEITPDIQSRVESKLARFNRHFGDEAVATVKILPEGNQTRVEVTINVHGRFFRSETNANDVRTALDQAVEILDRQIRRHRTRIVKQNQMTPGLKSFLAAEVEADDLAEDEEPVIRHKSFELTPMTAEEATLQMELLGHDFYVFLYAETGKVSVVYKRRDGSYGWIEPIY